VSAYLAHSEKNDIPAQTYAAHIEGVVALVRRFAGHAGRYGMIDGGLLSRASKDAATFHDLGKLDADNQFVLRQKNSSKPLPVNHADAGTAFFLRDEAPSLLPAIAVTSHHAGLPNFITESNREGDSFRDDRTRDRTDGTLDALARIHRQIVSSVPSPDNRLPQGDLSVFLRLLLSCLVDADHTNTAQNYRKHPVDEPEIALHPAKRLDALDKYVSGLPNAAGERGTLRAEMYRTCKMSLPASNIVSCDSPVGSGKTAAIMANLLAQAKKRGLRRIFVVLPFTNIIAQSVKVYREAIVLPGENPADVVAELHHRAEFESEGARYLTALWRAPIVVTTAVAFFETLASNKPSVLRKLHELPGSAIFVDEAHAALPVQLLPIAWRWMNVFGDEWSCYWVLASGSLNRFWEIREISEDHRDIPEIVDASLRKKLFEFERNRITYKYDFTPKTVDELADWVNGTMGPRLVIVNTVRSAAVIAKRFHDKFGRESVEHLSTALTPSDREKTLERIKARLANKTDANWTLIATSCVEAGVDLSFRSGFRELGALTSLLQTAGRINRSGDADSAQMWTFCLMKSDMLTPNPGTECAEPVLRKLLASEMEITPSLTTRAIEDEIKLYGKLNALHEQLVKAEDTRNFPFVNNKFVVIDSDTRIAVIDKGLSRQILTGQIDWRILQRHSVQIARNKLVALGASEITDGIYDWTFGYDSFLGYMAGIIKHRIC
jgi:CRISPR-associated endonuclease/helicase Cas3